jgi:hypothetical protein
MKIKVPGDKYHGMTGPARIQAEKERTALIGPDKMFITTIVSGLNEWIDTHKIPVLNTAEANSLLREKIAAIKAAIHELEIGGARLV